MSFNNKFGSMQAQVDEAAETEQPKPAQKKSQKNFGHGREPKKAPQPKMKSVPTVQDKAKMEEGGFTVSSWNEAGEGKGDRGGRRNDGDRPRTARGGREGGDRPATGRGRGRGNRDGENNRGGRGARGGRPHYGYDRTRHQAVDGDNTGPDHHGRGVQETHGYQGKAREEWHPMDRHSGTGVGKKDQRKGGNRPGGTGADRHDNFPAEEKKVEETEAEALAEGKDPEKEEPVVEEKKVEEEEVDEEALEGISFSDYEAKRQLERETGILATKKAREHVELAKDNVMENKAEKTRINQIDSKVTGRDMHATKAGSGAEFLGFSGVDDEDGFEQRRGGGGRGGRGRGDRQQAPRQGGKKGGKIMNNDDDFPTLM